MGYVSHAYDGNPDKRKSVMRTYEGSPTIRTRYHGRRREHLKTLLIVAKAAKPLNSGLP